MESLGSESLEPLKIRQKSLGPITALSPHEETDPAGEVSSLDSDRIIREPFGAHSPSRRPALRFSDASSGASLQREVALWRSRKMQAVWKTIQQAANVDVTVLISGETGTGKDLVARAIHHLSSRPPIGTSSSRWRPPNFATIFTTVST
jgi:transcriptional regulator of acetoin/glycerol metabolism